MNQTNKLLLLLLILAISGLPSTQVCIIYTEEEGALAMYRVMSSMCG